MRAWSIVGPFAGAALVALAWPVTVSAQAAAAAQPAAAAQVPPAAHLNMASAVSLALAHNHQLIATRLSVDISKADEITAHLKPNPVATSTNENFPVFSPSQLTLDNIANNQNYVESVGYLFERGGKREKRTLVAQDTTTVATHTAKDAERQLVFQTAQAFINVLLAKSTLQLAQQDLQNFANVVDVNQQRVTAGDLAEADFFKISLQKLQFEQDVSNAEVALVQAKTALRLNVGLDAVAEDFDVDGDLAHTKYTASLDDLTRDAVATRPDLLAAQQSTKLAEDTHALDISNRALDVTGEVEYDRAGSLNALGFGISIPIPIHDRNQGNIAHSQIAIHQASEQEAQAHSTVLTDVSGAFATYQTNEKILGMFESGYLDQARQSLDISNYVYQQGNGNLLDLLDAERTYRATELAFRQALAAYMTSVEQINFVVGKQVMQ
ncbi:MAG TPA: TolC family protein [Vicinamibacterales bacterium]|jgi:cobalt-zinc-cadmium efflux system outer membrane protein|nr:TolC family protein [Vicinamibacterales bacterium]